MNIVLEDDEDFDSIPLFDVIIKVALYKVPKKISGGR